MTGHAGTAAAWDGHRRADRPPRARVEGVGAALRTYLRAFRGVHKRYWHLYVATDEAMANAKRVTSHLIRRMRVGTRLLHTGYT
jgi:hypothetical protein